MRRAQGEDALQRAPGQAALEAFLVTSGTTPGESARSAAQHVVAGAAARSGERTPSRHSGAATPPAAPPAAAGSRAVTGGLLAFLAPPPQADGSSSPHSPCSAPARAQLAQPPGATSPLPAPLAPQVTLEPHVARCPLCGLDVTGWLTLRLNQHVDQCLGLAPAPKRRRVGAQAAAASAHGAPISAFFTSTARR